MASSAVPGQPNPHPYTSQELAAWPVWDRAKGKWVMKSFNNFVMQGYAKIALAFEQNSVNEWPKEPLRHISGYLSMTTLQPYCMIWWFFFSELHNSWAMKLPIPLSSLPWTYSIALGKPFWAFYYLLLQYRGNNTHLSYRVVIRRVLREHMSSTSNVYKCHTKGQVLRL